MELGQHTRRLGGSELHGRGDKLLRNDLKNVEWLTTSCELAADWLVDVQ